MDIELTKTIARVRRAMPRNADVMALCDALELITQTAFRAGPIENLPMLAPGSIERFDRKAYQRDYMRKKRASLKKD